MYTACGDVDKPSAPRPRPDIPKTEPGVAKVKAKVIYCGTFIHFFVK